jgi:hypothetical protein
LIPRGNFGFWILDFGLKQKEDMEPPMNADVPILDFGLRRKRKRLLGTRIPRMNQSHEWILD